MTITSSAAEAASNLRAELARANRKKGEMAHALNMSPAAVTRRLSGETPLDVNELCAVAEWLDIPVTRLLPSGVDTTTSGWSARSRQELVAA